jgi:cobalt/nickel transport system permease protein
MHVPDGFLDAPTSLATGAVAAAGVTLALRKARAELDERAAPLAGLTAAFVFAAQMVNFPVGIGTSGHLMGGALAAVLVGPWTGVLAVSVVLAVQALLFADGGLTALGTNITLLGLTTVVVGWTAVRGALAVLPRRPSAVVPAAAFGAFLSVPAAAAVFVVLFGLGGAAGVPLGALTVSMLGWHALIGIGEAVITGLTVSAVIAVRPDLVYAARGLRPELVLKGPDGSVIGVAPSPPPARARGLLAGGGLVVVVIAGVVSLVASSKPDGLDYVADAAGFAGLAGRHALGEAFLADYGDVGGVPVGLAGLVGVVVTVAAGALVFRLVRGRSREPQRAPR